MIVMKKLLVSVTELTELFGINFWYIFFMLHYQLNVVQSLFCLLSINNTIQCIEFLLLYCGINLRWEKVRLKFLYGIVDSLESNIITFIDYILLNICCELMGVQLHGSLLRNRLRNRPYLLDRGNN